MYFYHNNKGQFLDVTVISGLTCGELTAVGGCLFGDTSDPGNLQFEWLEEQLEIFRARQVQVRVIIVHR